MDAERLLECMCRRHGLPVEGSRALVPLVSRALASPASVRDRILALIEDNLARRAGGDATAATPEALERDIDDEVLVSVARVLHGWQPSKKVVDMGTIDPDDLPRGLGGLE